MGEKMITERCRLTNPSHRRVRVAAACAATALMATSGWDTARAASTVASDTQYQFQNAAGNFSTGFTPTFTSDANGELNFGGTTYTATDDLSAASVNNLTLAGTGLITLSPGTATNVLTLTNSGTGVGPSISVGTGGATDNVILAGSAGFTLSGGGTLTLATNVDTVSGPIAVNGSTLALSIGQSSAATFYLNGGTLTGNQALAATNVIYATTGTSTVSVDASGTLNSLIGGNGNIIWGEPLLTGVGSGTAATSIFGSFGGTVSFGSSASGIRLNGGTSAATSINPFANIDLGSSTAYLYTKTGSFTEVLGGLQGTGTGTAVGGSATAGHSNIVIVGSANLTQTFAGQIQNSAASGTEFMKVGTGTFTLTGTDAAVNVYTGSGATGFSNAVHGGVFQLNESVHPTGLLATTSTMQIGYGGVLQVLGNSTSTTASTETIAGLTVAAGGGGILITPNGGLSTSLALGPITATAAGASLNVTENTGTAVVTTTTAKDATGIYGGRITFTDASGNTNWATSAGSSSPYTLSGYAGYAALNTTGGTTDAANSLLNDSATLGTAATTITNSLKLTDDTAGQSLNLAGGTLKLANGGLLFTGANAYTVGVTAGDTLESGSLPTTPDLIVSQYGTGNLTIGAVIANGGTGASTLTKAGPGTLTLTGANTYTGATFLNGGVTSISAAGNLGTGTALNLNAGTLQATASLTLASAVNVGGGGGTLDATGGTTLTVSGVVANTNANEFGPLTKTDGGTVVLAGTNTYGGATIINGGVLSTPLLANGLANSGIGSAPNTANALVLNGGTLRYTGGGASTDRSFTLGTGGGGLDASGTGPVTFTNLSPVWYTASGSRTLTLNGTNAGANTLAAPVTDPASVNPALTGSTSLTMAGSGQWVLGSGANTYTGPTTISGSGTLALGTAGAPVGSTNSVASSSSINVGTTSSSATLNVAGLVNGTLVVAPGQTLSGMGTVAGSVAIGSGSILTPGGTVNPVGTLTVSGGLSLTTGSIADFEFNTSGGAANDQVAVGGALALSGTDYINIYQSGSTTAKFTTPGTYTLFTFGSQSGSPTDFSVQNPAAGLTYAFADNGAALQLTIGGTAAISSTWNVDASGNYLTATNWSPQTVPNAVGATAIFGGVITAPGRSRSTVRSRSARSTSTAPPPTPWPPTRPRTRSRSTTAPRPAR